MNEVYRAAKPEMDGWKAGTILLAVFLLAGIFAFALKGFAPAQGAVGVIVLALVIVVGFLLYALPSIVAIGRKHHQMVPILLLNIFLGWTFLGWVGALIWSASAKRND